MSEPKVIARLAGIVQGVVVQITTDAPSQIAVEASSTIGNFTQIVGEVCLVVLDLGLGQRGLLDRRTTSPASSRGRAGRERRTS